MKKHSLQPPTSNLQDSAERSVLRLVSSRVAKAMEGAKAHQWLPLGPLPKERNAYLSELIGLLQVVGGEGWRHM